jgi:nicotinamidase/pyrazinamidase
MKPRPALIIVDVQRDFCPGGALPVRDGDKIIPKINLMVSLFERRGLPVIFSRDWHPADHCSFTTRGGPWPAHCVKSSTGAQFHPSLRIPDDATVISKATRTNLEAYSAFQHTNLAERLKRMGVDRLYVAGLATDYCVKNTVLDGISAGFEVQLVSDSIRGVNVKRTDSANAIRKMVGKGAKKTSSTAVLRKLD